MTAGGTRRQAAEAPDDVAAAAPVASQTRIARQVVEAILAQKLAPGERLGEQELADLYGVSRTLVREALMQLQARGFVEVRTRKGWYVVEPSIEQARDAFAARRAVEAGMLREAQAAEHGRPLQAAIRRLRQHVKDEQGAIAGGDAATRTFLLADFHVCLAECLGHRLLADMLRDLTARTSLVALLYQSTHDARQSCAEHAQIVGMIEKGQLQKAAELMLAHIGNVESALGASAATEADARERLRASLAPIGRPGAR
jgi:DNA-binding GntR family transcriptional regulator